MIIFIISWFGIGFIATIATLIKSKLDGNSIKEDLKYAPAGCCLGAITVVIIIVVLMENNWSFK